MKKVTPYLALSLWLLLFFWMLNASKGRVHNTDLPTSAPITTFTIWSPIHVAPYGEQWFATKDGTPVLSLEYPKQDQQTDFKLVGLFNGDGSVLLSYADLGDEVFFDYTQPTSMTINTNVPVGGGTVPLPLTIYLTQRGAGPASITNPNLMVGQPDQ